MNFLKNLFSRNEKEQSPRKRIILKVSGEAFGDKDKPLQKSRTEYLAREILKAAEQANFVIIPGGGNILRGKDLADWNFGKVDADYLGMIATVYNGVALKQIFSQMKTEAEVLSAIAIEKVVKPYSPLAAEEEIRKGKIVIVTAGTGNPFVTTDTAAALRAMELNADMIIKATKVEGVYSDDPNKNKDARFFSRLTYRDAIEKNLKVCDKTAMAMLENSGIKFAVINVFKEDNIKKTADGQCPGTIISK
ncbi:MAG: UMP kinase [Elusimicrobia bacterium]|nr:UMP kinase [Elusimicrobiota bacterium]